MADSKKYDGSQWEHSLRKQTTASEIIVPPTTIYADGTAISTYTIKGNTTQSGTPSPSSPISVNGVGELETTGEHTGEYKIPILTPQGSAVNYLGNINSRRLVKKVVLTGTETEDTLIMQSTNMFYVKINSTVPLNTGNCLCTHYVNNQVLNVQMNNGEIKQDRTSAWGETSGVIVIKDTSISTLEGFKSFLAAQYAAGTPVTIWYVISLPEISVVNEPLMKIGDYSDSISNAAAIPTTDGANQISIDTTVQPSEFSATWTGWHDSSVKEYDGTNWQ